MGDPLPDNPTPFVGEPLPAEGLTEIEEDVYFTARDVRDPEYPYNLGQLRVIYPQGISVDEHRQRMTVEFKPTVEHCSSARLISLCIRTKLVRDFGDQWKITVNCRPHSHHEWSEISKQVNDKERYHAALENDAIRLQVEQAIADSE